MIRAIEKRNEELRKIAKREKFVLNYENKDYISSLSISFHKSNVNSLEATETFSEIMSINGEEISLTDAQSLQVKMLAAEKKALEHKTDEYR